MPKKMWIGPLNYDEFMKALKCITYACDQKETRYFLDHFFFDGPNKRIVTTNGVQIAMIRCNCLPPYEFLIHCNEISVLKTHFETDLDKFQMIIYGTKPLVEHVEFDTPSYALRIAVKINGYPDYRSVIGEVSENWIMANRKEWLNELSQIVKSYKSKPEWQLNNPVAIQFDGHSAKLKAEHIDYETLLNETKYRGNVKELHFDAKLLKKSISAVKSKHVWINQREKKKGVKQEPPILLVETKDSEKQTWERMSQVHLLYPLNR